MSALAPPVAPAAAPPAALHDDPDALPEGAACASCGAPLAGPYCHRCGEKRLGPHDYNLAHFVEHAVDTATHFDFKVAKGAWSLLRHPGRMSADVLAGRRVAWPKPLQLFLVVNVVFFLISAALSANIFDTPLRYQVGMQAYGHIARAMTEAKLAAAGPVTEAAWAAYAARFDAKAHTLSKSLIFVLIPLVTAVLALFQAGRPRRVLEHVTVATHLVTAALLVLMSVLGAFLVLATVGVRNTGDDLSTALFLAGFTGVASGTFRHAYGDRWGWAAVKAVGFAAAFVFGLVLAYRFVLFLVVHALV